MLLSFIAVVPALLTGIAYALPTTEVGLDSSSTKEVAPEFAYAHPNNADDSIPPSLPSEVVPLSLNQIKELSTRSPEMHQDPYNITNVDGYRSLYKRSVGCDPIGCFDGAFFSIIFHYSGENGVYLYGADQSPQRHNFNCASDYQGFNSWLPWVFESKLQPTGVTGCAFTKDRSHVYIKYASIIENLRNDPRCGDNGGVDGGTTNARCIFPVHP